MFENLKKAVIENSKKETEKRCFFIENGYLPTWCENERKFSDRGIQNYSTDLRWSQYTSGKISREKAVEYAVKRYMKTAEKKLEKDLAKVDRIAAAAELAFADVNVDFVKNRYWGSIPHATVSTNNGVTGGKASGYGYDKESAAVAEAFNANDSVLKVIYTLKENALAAGVSDYSKTACTGVNNSECIGYGAGYTTLPYFEGGVGVGCFWSMFEKAGYTVRSTWGKRENIYTIYKA